MGLNFQPYIQQLDRLSFTLAATGTSPQEIDLKKLEKRLYKRGELANVIAFLFEIDLDPTFTNAGTLAQTNACLSKILLTDGKDTLFEGTPNDLRMFERMENGGTILGETITQTSTNNMHLSRVLHMGPPRLIGWPSDFAVNAAELAQGGGKIVVTPGVFADIGADATAATVTVDVYAVMAPSGNELRIGPKYQRIVKPISNTQTTINDEALYAYIAAVDAAYAAFAAGDFVKFSLFNTMQGDFLKNVDAEGISRVFNTLFRPGIANQVYGEARSSTDVAFRMLNFSTPTALAALTADLQMVAFCPPDTRLSKIRVRNDAGDTLTIQHAGAQAANTGSYLLGRFLPHTQSSVRERAQNAATLLGTSFAEPMQKTLNKRAVRPSVLSVKYGVFAAKTAG